MTESNTDGTLPGSLSHTIASSDLQSFAGDLAEVALDSVLKEGLFRDIPVVGSLLGILKLGATVKDALLFRKLVAFLGGIATVPGAKRAQMISLLQSDDAVDDVGEKLLSLLDRLETSTKAKLLGRAFVLLAEETITTEEFWRVSFVLDRVPLSDILALTEWESLDLNAVGHVRRQMYLSAGLGWYVLDFSSTGFRWQARLCGLFAEYLLDGARA
jgi:hypothetical protein